MDRRIVLTGSLVLALLAAGCSGSSDDGGAASGDATTPASSAVDAQTLALGASDLPEGWAPAALDTGEDQLAPEECPAFGRLELSDEVGVAFEAQQGFSSIEMRIADQSQADRVLGALREMAGCPDTSVTQDDMTMELSFDGLDLPAGDGAALSGTAAGFAVSAKYVAFEAGGHLVAILVLGLGGEPEGVDIGSLVQLTLDRADGSAEPAPDAPTLAAPGEDAGGSTGGAATSGAGSRDEPLAVGEQAEVGVWTVSIDAVELDADAAIAAANEFNDPPENGNYALVMLTATYHGDDEGTAGFDLTLVLSGADSRQYPDSDCLATEPEPMFDQPVVESGGTVTGQFCLDYPDAAIGAGAVLFIEETISMDDTRRYWQLPEAPTA